MSSFKDSKLMFKNQWKNYLLAILVPIVLMLIVLVFVQGNIGGFMPVWSDEIDYWIQIKGIVTNGFYSTSSGYFGINEETASRLYYGCHGIFLLIPYALIGKVIGWNLYTPLIANIIILIIAMIIFVILTKNIKKTILASSLIMTYGYLLIYYQTMMTEVLFYGLGIVIAPIMILYLRNEDQDKNKKYAIWLFLLATIASLLRISNIVFFIPFLLKINFKKKISKVFFLLGVLLYSGILYIIQAMFSAPYMDGVLYEFKMLFSGGFVSESMWLLINNAQVNIALFFTSNSFLSIEGFIRYIAILLCVVYLAISFFRFFTAKGVVSRKKTDLVFLNNFLILIFSIIIIVVLYDVFMMRDTRTLAPIVFTTLLVSLIYEKSSRFLKGSVFFLAVISFCVVFGNLKEFATNRFDYTISESKIEIIQSIEFDENSKQRWSNTVVIEGFYHEMMFLEPGLAINFVPILDFSKIKSKYVYTGQVLKEEHKNNFILLLTKDNMYLYENKNYK